MARRGGSRYRSLRQRLRALTVRRKRGLNTPCWEWCSVKRGRTGNYPRVNLWAEGQARQLAAHRLSKVVSEIGRARDEHLALALYDLYKVAGFELDHECENPCCVRPSHLTWRDHDDHLELTVQRRRARRGRCDE